ncbi:MAG: UbiA family prenyltransferase [Candidatus Micrarchaeota archaeon]
MKNIYNFLLNWHKLFRSEHALITFLGVLVGAILSMRGWASSRSPIPGDFFNFYPGSEVSGLIPFSSLGFLFLAVGPALITLAAFALNDYFGYETDKANKRSDRPLVSGKIKREHALYAALFLFAAGLACTYFVNFTVFLLSLVYVVLCFLYDTFLKKLPLIGNVFIGLTMAAPFIYGQLTAYPEFVFASPSGLLVAIAFLVGIGRELLITLRDVEGDKKIGANTLPMILGGKNTVYLSTIFILVAIGLALIPTLYAPLSYVAFLVPTVLLLLFTVYKALKSQDAVTLKQCGKYSLYALMAGVLAFFALAVNIYG